MAKLKIMSKRDYELMLITLEKKGRDGFALLGDGIIAALGAAGGALSASAIAGATGATSIFGITTAASWIGVTAVASTPIGWIASCAVVGGALTYGASYVIKYGTIHTERRKRLAENIREKIAKFQEEEKRLSDDEQFRMAIEILHTAYLKEKLLQNEAIEIVYNLKNHNITPQDAVGLLSIVCQ